MRVMLPSRVLQRPGFGCIEADAGTYSTCPAWRKLYYGTSQLSTSSVRLCGHHLDPTVCHAAPVALHQSNDAQIPPPVFLERLGAPSAVPLFSKMRWKALEFVSLKLTVFCAGRNKLIINHLGRLFVTSDAATIIREIEVAHPAAKLLVMASTSQETEVR